MERLSLIYERCFLSRSHSWLSHHLHIYIKKYACVYEYDENALTTIIYPLITR